MHADEPAVAYLPAGQDACTPPTQKYPGEQAVHTVAEGPEVSPSAHTVGEADPWAQYDPAGQAVQEKEPEGAYDPGAHTVETPLTQE